MMARAKKTSDALRLIDRMVGDDAELRAMIDEERAGADIAQLIHDARTRAGLTQQQLAERIGTSQPTIARLEDADYDGHSLGMLRRIAAALKLRLEVRLVPGPEAA
jgi:ribosome-binding protein aMBF1 (putative translation factor)